MENLNVRLPGILTFQHFSIYPAVYTGPGTHCRSTGVKIVDANANGTGAYVDPTPATTLYTCPESIHHLASEFSRRVLLRHGINGD
jgi:hypothetical protein